MYQKSRFQKGSGAYACRVCERTTRSTGDNGWLRLCPQCFDLAGWENSRSDNGPLSDDETHDARRLLAELATFKGAAVEQAVKDFTQAIFGT